MSYIRFGSNKLVSDTSDAIISSAHLLMPDDLSKLEENMLASLPPKIQRDIFIDFSLQST